MSDLWKTNLYRENYCIRDNRCEKQRKRNGALLYEALCSTKTITYLLPSVQTANYHPFNRQNITRYTLNATRSHPKLRSK